MFARAPLPGNGGVNLAIPSCQPVRLPVKAGKWLLIPALFPAILRWLAGQEPSSVFATTITQAKLLNEEFADRILYFDDPWKE